MPNIPQQDEVTEFPACCAVMRRFDIDTKKRAAAWLGNVAKESGELYYTEEIASGADYEGRADLGQHLLGQQGKELVRRFCTLSEIARGAS